MSSLIPSTERERQVVSDLQENLGPVKEKASEFARDVGDETSSSRHKKLLSRSRRPHRKASRTSRTRVSTLRPTSRTRSRSPRRQSAAAAIQAQEAMPRHGSFTAIAGALLRNGKESDMFGGGLERCAS